MALLGGETNFVGIDIGSSGIRLVQLKHGGGKPLLVTFGDMKVPLNLTQSDAEVDIASLVQQLTQLLAETNVSTKQAVLGIPSSKVYSSVIVVPQMSHSEVEKGIRYQAERSIPLPLDQVKLDWSVIKGDNQAKEMEVLIVATPTRTAQRYLEICEQAGLTLVGLEPNALAMSQALVSSDESCVILLDMGGLNTDLTIQLKGVPRLIAAIPVGGLSFAKAVAQHLGVEQTQAEQFIIKFGLTQDKLEGQVLAGVKPMLDTLVAEIQKAIQYFGEHHPGVKIEKAVLTGGSSLMPQFPTYMANILNLPVEVGNPWENVSYPSNLQEKLLTSASQYAVAAGLAQMEVS